MNMVGNIGAALSAIMFPILLNEETGSANTFFILAAGLNFVAIVTWCFMNPNRTSDKEFSPQAIRRRFIAMLTSLVLLTGGTIGYNIYKSSRKKSAPVEDTNKVDQENQITTENDK
jgi:nitrate/nitrite transporter NarK